MTKTTEKPLPENMVLHCIGRVTKGIHGPTMYVVPSVGSKIRKHTKKKKFVTFVVFLLSNSIRYISCLTSFVLYFIVSSSIIFTLSSHFRQVGTQWLLGTSSTISFFTNKNYSLSGQVNIWTKSPKSSSSQWRYLSFRV